jgi:hypothetical protein
MPNPGRPVKHPVLPRSLARAAGLVARSSPLARETGRARLAACPAPNVASAAPPAATAAAAAAAMVLGPTRGNADLIPDYATGGAIVDTRTHLVTPGDVIFAMESTLQALPDVTAGTLAIEARQRVTRAGGAVGARGAGRTGVDERPIGRVCVPAVS